MDILNEIITPYNINIWFQIIRNINSGIGISSLSMILQGSRSKKLNPYMKSPTVMVYSQIKNQII